MMIDNVYTSDPSPQDWFFQTEQSVLTIDEINRRIGINNLNPQFDLDVNNTINTETLLASNAEFDSVATSNLAADNIQAGNMLGSNAEFGSITTSNLEAVQIQVGNADVGQITSSNILNTGQIRYYILPCVELPPPPGH
jgi:hypothetical protein